MYRLYTEYLAAEHNEQKYRRLPCCRQEKDRVLLNFSTNDYLSLSKHPQVIRAAQAAAERYGVGATGSRLLSGNHELFMAFEEQIARDKKTETAVLFNSGFQANISVLSAILDQRVLKTQALVFFDRANHASLYQAVFLSKAELCRYWHNDLLHLADCLNRYRSSTRPKYIVTETVFGMDGDHVDMSELIALATEHGAFLYLDEAHSTGMMGPHGYGLSTAYDLDGLPHIVMGTLSKAVGCSGAYVACSRMMRDFIINRAGGFIYSTGPSPAVVGAAFQAWSLIPVFRQERSLIRTLSKQLSSGLIAQGGDIGCSQTHIVTLILKTSERCLFAKEFLLKQGIQVSCIRPPTVPQNTARLRMAMTVDHRQEDIECLLLALKEVLS